jgi:hypothetical protein
VEVRLRLEVWIAIVGCVGTVLLVLVGLLNFSIFSKQLTVAREQIATMVRQLDLAQKAPDLQLIQRAIAETSDHVKMMVERPYLRPYFYENVAWKAGDQASEDEIRLVAELILNNFASALMHSAAFPQYPARGVDRIIAFHLRHSPALRDFLHRHFERFPFSGLTLLAFGAEARDGVAGTRNLVAEDLRALADDPSLDARESARRRELLELWNSHPDTDPMDFVGINMERRR